MEYYSVEELLQEIIDQTGYVKELEAEDTEEAKARIENIDELISKVVSYEKETEDPTLSGFLEEVALVADIDSMEEDSNRVVLMTLHSAKGLEFPNVYLAGMEDGMFPSYMCIVSEDPSDLEEERRLCYVGITRAKEHLTITSARARMIRGETQYNKVSRFVPEIPRELVQVGNVIKPKVQELPKKTAYQQAKQAFQTKAFEPSQYKVTKADSLDYVVGDRVKHIKFGPGTVENIVDGGKDYEVTVNFDRAGVKKMFAAFAKLKKI
jgi:DNA helicase-2/ATP-dependent DNA helicase PcrA